MSKRIELLVIGLVFLGGCGSDQGRTAFGLAGASVGTYLGSSTTSFTSIRTQDALTRASDDFLRNRPENAQPRKECPTTVDKELALAQERAESFNKVIEPYTAAIEAVLKNDIEYQKYADAIKGFYNGGLAASNLNKTQFAFLQSLSTFADQAAALAIEIERYRDTRKLVKFARDKQKLFDRAIDDLKVSLESVDRDANAQITAWAECERHRLRYIYADESVSVNDMATLFEAFYLKLTALRSSVGKNNSEELLENLKKAHAELASGRANFLESLALGTRLAATAKATRDGARTSNDALIATRTKQGE